MAAITKKRKLRTGRGQFSADAADGDDVWLIRIDEQVEWDDVLELWALDGALPQPKVTFRALGSNFVVCDSISTDNADKQRYLWRVTVKWKELSDSDPKPQTQPTPTTNSTDPANWAPTVSRRPATVYEPAEKMFYESGYGGNAHTKYAAEATAGNRSPLTNSALTPFVDNLPPHRRNRSLYTIRWLRATIPSGLLDAEGKVNSTAKTFSHRGLSQAFAVKTALIESIQLTQTAWGSQQLWEIVMEVLYDSEGHFVTTLDEGLMEGYWPGESLNGSSVLVFTSHLIKAGPRPVAEAVLLDGSGKRLASNAAAVFGKWRDAETTEFNSVPLLGDLIS